MSFKILKKDKNTKARLGLLKTPHGTLETPSYVFVGTYGRFLHLKPNDLKKSNVGLIIANTFHLWKKALKSKDKEGFIHKSFGLKIPIMTDSGGFQVLSLAFGDKTKVSPEVEVRNVPKGAKAKGNSNFHFGVGKFIDDNAKLDENYKRKNVRITSKGVFFKYKGEKKFLGPELSMKIQRKIGADILFAFDHITSPLDTFEYNKKALELTNKWALICLKEHAKNQKNKKNKQQLFGIVQGGIFPELRKQSAKYIGSLPFDGFGIGGSYTKKQIAKVLKWVIPHLPDEKPRHLLGVGKVEDVFEAIENGIDTFDCVIPTREARHGRLYTKTGHMDIRRGYYTNDKKVIEKGCGCPACSNGISRAEIRALITAKVPADLIKNGKYEAWGKRRGVGPHNEVDNRFLSNPLNAAGQRWCLMHNMWFFNKLLEDIRSSIKRGKLREFRNKTLTTFKN